MRRFMSFAAAMTLIAGALTAPGRAQDSVQGEWRAKFERGADSAGSFYFEIRTETGRHKGSWGHTHKVGDFWGLDAGLASKEGAAHFELRREAGTLAFDGKFQGGEGQGDFHFTPNAEFVQAMKGLGYSGLTIEQLLAFATQDVNTQFVKELNELGYRNVPADDLLALRIHGATPEFIRAMKAVLPSSPTLDELVAMRIHGVSPEFVKEMKSLLGKNFDVDQYVAFRIHGVSPEFVKEMKDLGYNEVSADQLVSMRIHGVDGAYVKEIRSRGYKNPTIDELIDMRIHGYPRRASM